MVTMKRGNGTEPAYPVVCLDGYVFGGLTKREVFAMNAPEVPSWFSAMWFKENCHVKEYFELPDPTYDADMAIQTAEGNEAEYFAWHTYYADKLLKQLEK